MKIRLALGTVALVALALLLRFGDIPEGSTVLDREWNDSLEAGSAEEPAPPHGQESREATREPRSLGFAGGIPSDTTGSLLPRDFPADDPALVSRYYLYLPAGIESGRQWPLILYLHGRSLRGSNLSILTRYGLPARLQNDRSFPFVVVAPQLPGGQSWTDTGRLARLVEDVAARYPIDHTRIYLIGYSMGAGGVWRTAIDHPEMFAAAAPTAAWTPDPDPEVARALRDLPIRIDHGTADEVAPFARAEAMAEALERAGVDVTFSVYPGADHGELTHIYKEDDLFTWLLSHRREGQAR
ncbi:MAG TPA: dienelactone hydrolase family protein [Gemmatimonadota bacterium]|nr:dienelactone hydrolase family protein [Gemmatimonadota bacterium]